MSKKNRFSNKYGELGPYLMLVTKLGLTMVLSILLFFFIGYYIDQKLQTNGLFMIVGIIVGVGAGFVWMYKEIMKTTDEPKKPNQKS